MSDNPFIQKAIEELETKSFGVTKQFLKIHEVVYEEGVPKVLRVDQESGDGTVIVYFAVKGERFYLAIYLDTQPHIAVRWVDTESYYSVYCRATSETLSYGELAALTKLKPTDGCNKGDQRNNGRTVYTFSAVEFEPNPEPDEWEDKLNKLLDFLEQDQEGVKALTDKTFCYIQVAITYHNGTSMLGGPHINIEALKRMAALHLAIDFDQYVSGNKYE
jgi:hypothetical protein